MNWDKYLDTTSQSSDRARTVFFLLQFACVLYVSAIWNNEWFPWTAGRIASLETIVQQFSAKNPLWEQKRQAYFEEHEKAHIAARINRLTTSVPILGIGVDVNDMAIIGGGSLAILLVTLRFCLGRELANLKIFFSHVPDGREGRDAYELLAMRQVFTVPTVSGVREPSSRIYDHLFSILICQGAVLQLLHVALTTPSYGEAKAFLGWQRAVGYETITYVVTLLLLTLTADCFQTSRSVNAEWFLQYERLWPNEVTDEAPCSRVLPPGLDA